MSDKKWRTWEVLGLRFVLAAGNLLHFVYDWTGQSPVVGALAAVNESVWEHMKLLTTPWVLWSIAELVAVGRSGLPVTAARAAGLLAGLAAIPMLFYTYQGVLGRDLMWLDIAIFQIAVLLGFWVSWTVLCRRALAAPLWQVAGGAGDLADDPGEAGAGRALPAAGGHAPVHDGAVLAAAGTGTAAVEPDSGRWADASRSGAGAAAERRGAAVVCAGDPAGHRLSAADGTGPVGGTVRGPLRPCHGGYPVLRGGFLYLLHLPQNCGGKSGIIMLYVKRRR